MEWHTDREEALYRTLTQVLHNHVVQHQIRYQETLAACVSVLGYLLYVMLEDWEDAPGLIESTVFELQQRTQARAHLAPPPSPLFQEYTAEVRQTTAWQDLGTALATYLSNAGVEHDMSVAATWRAYLAVLADLHALPLYAGVYTPTEANAVIADLRSQLPVVMRLWAEEQAEEEAP